MRHLCNTCGRSYSNNRNLNRHIKERHSEEVLFFKCSVQDCKAKLLRRSYLSKHLEKIHKMNKTEVHQLVSNASLTTENKQRKPLNEMCHYEDISEDEIDVSDTHPYEDVSEGEFEEWLDNMLDETCSSNTVNNTELPSTPKHDWLEDLVNEDSMNVHVVNDSVSIGEDPEIFVEVPQNQNDDDNASEDIIPVIVHEINGDVVPIVQHNEEINNEDNAIDDNIPNGDVVPVFQHNEEIDNDDNESVITISSDEEESTVELFSVTLKSTKYFNKGNLTKVDRVASVAYSDDFNPSNRDPMEMLQQIQEEFVDYIQDYGK